jgi:O-antigen/teichoic acid export membrane protein
MKLATLQTIGRNQWLLADQALVSAMNFLTSVMLARMLGVHNFGVFSLFYVVLQYLNSIQQAAIVGPMMTLAPKITDRQKMGSFLAGMVSLQYLFSAACCIACLLAAFLGHLRVIPFHIDRVFVVPFLLAVIFFQCQDWYRRFCYVHEDGKEVFWNDAISYLGQVFALSLLWYLHRADVMTAFYAIAITSGVAYFVACIHSDLRGSPNQMRAILPEVWRMGRGLLVASQSQWAGSQGVLLIIAAMVGVSAIGGTRAAMTMMGPVFVLFQLTDNVIPVRASRIYAQSGHDGMVHYLKIIGTKFAILVGVLVTVAGVVAKPLMTYVFGKSYTSFSILVFWLGIYCWLAVFLRMFQYYYRTVGRANVLAGASSLASVASLCAAVVLAKGFGAVGAMAALVLGEVLSIAVLGWRALRDGKPAERTTPA